MSETFEAMLLIDDAPSEEFASAVEEAGLYDRLDLTRRPGAAAMGIKDGLPTLAGPGVQALVRLLASKKPLYAFSHAPAGDLDALESVVFSVRSLHIRVRRTGPELGPYYRRLVLLERVRAAAPTDICDRVPRVETEMAGLPALSIDPLIISVTEDEGAKLIEALPADGPVLLPPTRQELPRGAYFGPERLAIRSGWLAKRNGAALFDLWRAEADPLLRDLFVDGGGLMLHVDADRPTAAAVGVWLDTHRKDRLAEYRAGFLLKPSGDAARSLLRDIQELTPTGLRVERVEARVQRTDLLRTEPVDPAVPAEGTAQQIATLGGGLNRKASALFTSLVAATTDHDLAERRFLAAFAQPGLIDAVGWRQAWFPSGLQALLGGQNMPEEIAGLSIDWSGPVPLAIHSPRAAESDLARWALLLPLGSRLSSDSEIRRDEGHELLAGGDWSLPPRISRGRPHPGQSLTAAVGRDQEAYLLSRAIFRSDLPGIAELTVGESVRVLPSRREIRVERLKGLTFNRRPVVLQDGDSLAAPLPGNSADCTFEAFVEVDPPDDDRRYRLVVLPLGEMADGLDLGGYAWRQGSPVRMIRRPACQMFNAITPWDESHAAPLIARLSELQDRYQGTWSSALAQQAFGNVLLDIADAWIAMPLDELEGKLAHLGWLLGHQPGGVRRTPRPPSDWASRPAQEWPAALAALTVPVSGEPPRDNALLEGQDYRILPGAKGQSIYFTKELGRGTLRFRFPPADEAIGLTLCGPGIRSVVELNGNGGELETTNLHLRDGLELLLSPTPLSAPLIFFKKG